MLLAVTGWLTAQLAPPFAFVAGAIGLWLLLRCLRGWDIGGRATVDLLPAGLFLLGVLPGRGPGLPPTVVLVLTGAAVVAGLTVNQWDQRRFGRPRWYADDLRLVAAALLYWLLAIGVNRYLLLLLPLALVRRPRPPSAMVTSVAAGIAAPDPPSSRQRRMLLDEQIHRPLVVERGHGFRIAFVFPGWLLLWVAGAPLRRRETAARAVADAAAGLLALGYLAPERRSEEARELLLGPSPDSLYGFECAALAAEAAYRLGRWDEVVAAVARAEEMSAEWPLAASGHELLVHLRLLAAVALARQDRILEAERLLEEMGPEPSTADERFLASFARAVIELARDGQMEGPLSPNSALGTAGRTTEDPIQIWWLSEITHLDAEAGLRAGAPREALARLASPLMAVATAAGELIAAEAALALGRRDAAIASLRHAVELTRETGPYGSLARFQLDQLLAEPTAPDTPPDS